MENHYKVELWIDELKKELLNSNCLKFNNNKDSLRIVNNNYEEIFSCLINDKDIKIANLDFNENNFYSVLEEYQNNSFANKKIELITTLKKDVQNQVLKEFKINNEKYILRHSVCRYFISFGLLDYYNNDDKHTLSSAPLVLLPIDFFYNEKEDFYQIKVKNHEIHLNMALIDFVRKTKKVDLSYSIDNNFSLNDYLLYVASKVHMFHWSVNNGCFISSFDIYLQDNLFDVIAHQEQISNNPLVKSISYYNAEFYNFTKNNEKLDKKLLSLLSLDNEEYRILKRIANCESLFIRTDNFNNKIHLFNNIVTNYLLNNKKVLVVYDSKERKDEIINHLDASIKNYSYDLNELESDKKVLLTRLNQYEGREFYRSSFDPIATQEVINDYYDNKNKFKSLINELRIKREPFGLSLNECIENYYRLNCPLVDVEIPGISSLNINLIENYVNQIREFEGIIRKLKCNYKEHPFYGFKKNSMMIEEYPILKQASLHLEKDIKKLQYNLYRLHTKYLFPTCLNIKQTKAVLNILSVIPFYRECPEKWFEITSWDKVKKQLCDVEKSYKSYINYKNDIVEKYGSNIFNIENNLFEKVYSSKNLSKKEAIKFKTYFKNDCEINLEFLKEVDGCIKCIEQMRIEYINKKEMVDESFDVFWKNDHYEMNMINEAEKQINIFHSAVKYLLQNKVPYSSKDLISFKDDNLYSTLKIIRLRIQIIFNRIFDNSSIIQRFFDEKLFDFSSLNFDVFYDKTKSINDDFASINNYLDFYVERYKLNHCIPNFADELLKEDNFDLYELMFYKRLYFDYANYLMSQDNNHKFNQDEIFSSVDAYKISEKNRISIVDSILKNNYDASLRNNVFNLKRYEYDFVESEKKNEKNRTLSRITFLAHESLFHLFSCLFTPLKSISSLLTNDQYYYDTVIFLVDKATKTKEVLSTLNKAKHIIVFDDEYISSKFNEDNEDILDAEFFFSAMKKSYETIDFMSKTYNVLKLKSNNQNPYFKAYLKKFLEDSGFKVASDVPFKNGTLDFVVKVEGKASYTALIIDRLPYYSLESAQETFSEVDLLLDGTYAYIRIFPFSFFKNEAKEKQFIVEQIVSNSLKEQEKKTKVVKKKLTDVIFLPYKHPYYVYHENKIKFAFNRQGLMLRVLEECAPILEEEVLNLFPKDGMAYLSILSKENKIYRKNKFIYVKDKTILFRSYKNLNQPRQITSLAFEEIEDGVMRIVESSETIELGTVIKMILLSLGYSKMNSKIHEYLYRIIIEMVHNSKLTLSENYLSLPRSDLKDEEIIESHPEMIKRDN